jgi:hypothetical protein
MSTDFDLRENDNFFLGLRYNPVGLVVLPPSRGFHGSSAVKILHEL